MISFAIDYKKLFYFLQLFYSINCGQSFTRSPSCAGDLNCVSSLGITGGLDSIGSHNFVSNLGPTYSPSFAGSHTSTTG